MCPYRFGLISWGHTACARPVEAKGNHRLGGMRSLATSRRQLEGEYWRWRRRVEDGGSSQDNPTPRGSAEEEADPTLDEVDGFLRQHVIPDFKTHSESVAVPMADSA